MNWKTIADKHPKAFYEMLVWMDTVPFDREFAIMQVDASIKRHKGALKYFQDEFLFSHEGFSWHPRNLYDFFDDQEIWIDIDHEFGKDWTFTIDEGRTGHNGDDIIYTSRQEAEQAAFEKAFKILEQKLKSLLTQEDKE